MSKRTQFCASVTGERGSFIERAYDSVPGISRSCLTAKLLLKWAEGVLGEKAPEAPNRGRPFGASNPNGLTAAARRLGVTPHELRKRLLKEALERMAETGESAAE